MRIGSLLNITNHADHSNLRWLFLILMHNSFTNHFIFLEEERFELAIINPALVLGPVICTATTSHSIEVCGLFCTASICILYVQ